MSWRRITGVVALLSASMLAAPFVTPGTQAATVRVAECEVTVTAATVTSEGWHPSERCSASFSLATPTTVTLALSGTLTTEGPVTACIGGTCASTTLVAGTGVTGNPTVSVRLPAGAHTLSEVVYGQQSTSLRCINFALSPACIPPTGYWWPANGTRNTAHGTFTATVERTT